MRLSENWPGTVYALADETGLVWYVGQTRWTLNNRLSRHLTEARRAKKKHPLCDWIRDRLETKMPINILLIERDAVWDVAETKWIAHYRSINPGLLNIMDGGSGTQKGSKLSEETKRRMSEARKAQWADPEYRARVTAGIKAERNTPEAKQRLSEMQKFAWQREAVRDARVSKRNETVQTDEFREKMRQSATKQMSDPEARKGYRGEEQEALCGQSFRKGEGRRSSPQGMGRSCETRGPD